MVDSFGWEIAKAVLDEVVQDDLSNLGFFQCASIDSADNLAVNQQAIYRYWFLVQTPSHELSVTELSHFLVEVFCHKCIETLVRISSKESWFDFK